jgi:hypothetical protein
MSTREYQDALNRIPTQQQKILDLLRDAGEQGITNKELSNVSLQYSARIHELRKAGCIIDHDKTEVNGVYRYYLRKLPATVKFFDSAENEFLNRIEKKYGLSLEIKEDLTELNFHVKRRANWYKENM